MSILAVVLSDPLPMWQGLLLVGILTIAFLVFAAFGFYLLIRRLGGKLDKRRESWANVATQLGLRLVEVSSETYKPLVGEQRGLKIEVAHFTANPRVLQGGWKFRVDDCVEVKVYHAEPLQFTFGLDKRELLYEKVGDYFNTDGPDVGHREFERTFTISCTEPAVLQKLLSTKTADVESTALADFLLAAATPHFRLRYTDHSLTIGTFAPFADPVHVRAIIRDALYLTERIAAYHMAFSK